MGGIAAANDRKVTVANCLNYMSQVTKNGNIYGRIASGNKDLDRQCNTNLVNCHNVYANSELINDPEAKKPEDARRIMLTASDADYITNYKADDVTAKALAHWLDVADEYGTRAGIWKPGFLNPVFASPGDPLVYRVTPKVLPEVEKGQTAKGTLTLNGETTPCYDIPGTSVEWKATAAEGQLLKIFATIDGENVLVLSSTETQGTLSMPEFDLTAVAEFGLHDEIAAYTVCLNAGEGEFIGSGEKTPKSKVLE